VTARSRAEGLFWYIEAELELDNGSAEV
jgi:hypothetical protein